MKFRAAILHKIGEDLLIEQIEYLETLQPGQVAVKLFYSGICGKQIEEIDGKGQPDPWIPHLLGHEGTGEIIATGPGVTKVTIGDVVVLHWVKGSGIQSVTPHYHRSNGEKVNAGWVTTFNEKAVVSENRVTKLNDDEDLSTSALFGCAVTTGIGAALNDADIMPHHSVAVFGCGGVGLFCIQGANLRKPKQIIGVDIDPRALQLATQLGATSVINALTENPIKAIQSVTNNAGADRVIIATNATTAIENAIDSAAIPSECIQVGVPIAGTRISIDAFAVMHKRNLRGSIGGSIFPDRDIPAYLNLASSGHIDVKNVISKVYDFDDINRAIRDFRQGQPGRILIQF